MSKILVKKYPLSIAPMMDWTDRHYRYFMRLITQETLLYTEMVTTGAILHGDRDRILSFSEMEKPLVIQLGGDNPQDLGESASIAESLGYNEINLNVGCPSDRVQNGNFGACLMAKPDLVARCVEIMKNKVKIPVTVKHRIGIDGRESYEEMKDFVETVYSAGCDRFIVHSRIAILKGLSPKGNRTVPPLRYHDVYRLKEELPNLIIELNGGVKTFDQVKDHLSKIDGVMIGREAYENPYLFARADQEFFGKSYPSLSRREIIQKYIPYVEENLSKGIGLNRTLIHILGLFNNKSGSKTWRRVISENLNTKNKDVNFLYELLKKLPQDVLDEK